MEARDEAPQDAPLWERPELRRRLIAFARRYVGDGGLAEDVVQEALLRASAGSGALRAPEKAEAWVFRICRHAAIDRVRTLRVRQGVWAPMPDGVDEWAAPASGVGAGDGGGGGAGRRDGLAGDGLLGEGDPGAGGPPPGVDLRRLPAHHRVLMTLHYERGLSQATLCRMTGLSPSALRVRLFRARGALAAAGRRAAPEPP